MSSGDVPVQRHVRRQRDRAAAGQPEATFLSTRTLDGLLERLEPVQLRPNRVLDLGGGRGAVAASIGKQWRKARVVSVDLAQGMLSPDRQAWYRPSRRHGVLAANNQLPFRAAVFDLVVANLTLNTPAEQAAFRDVARVLRPGGLLLLAALGPDSLRELRQAWAAVDDGVHVSGFADMHDLGDALVRSGFSDPVLDVERLQVTYADVRSLYRDLTDAAARNLSPARRRSLTGKDRWRRFEAELIGKSGDDGFAVTLEVVFAHAWSRGAQPAAGEFPIDAGAIPVRHRKSADK